MDRQRVMITDPSEEFALALQEAMQDEYEIRYFCDGVAALHEADSFRPQILVVDLMLPGLDGLTLIHRLSQLDTPPRVLAASRFISEYVLRSIEQLGVGYLMRKPCSIQAVCARIRDLSLQIPPFIPSKLEDIFKLLGISSRLHGYAYLREAIPRIARNPNLTATKQLYPDIGAVFGVQGSRVERSIRNAITRGWETGDPQVWQQYFPTRVKRPSNMDFICCIASLIQNASDLP